MQRENSEQQRRKITVASLCKKRGSSGLESPYWIAIVTFQKRKIWLSTKCRSRIEAKKVSNLWSDAAELAQERRLDQIKINRLKNEIGRITPCPMTLENSTKLFKMLLLESVGESYQGANLTEYAEEWLPTRRATTKVATQSRYEQVIRGFIGSLPEHRRTAEVSTIAAKEVRLWRDGLVTDGLSESTCNVGLSIVRSLFGDARKQGILAINPAEAVPALHAVNVDERHPFSAEQVKALLAVADIEWTGMVLFRWCCGLRISDAANLCWNNVDLVNPVLSFEQRKTSHRKRRKSERTTVIYLHDDLLAYLVKIGGSDQVDAPLFPSLRGLGTSGPQGLSQQFIRLMARAGITSPKGQEKTGRGRQFSVLSFHSLRHSFVSRLANAEVPMEIRKTMSGHSSDSVHANYSHLSIELQKSAIGRLTSVL